MPMQPSPFPLMLAVFLAFAMVLPIPYRDTEGPHRPLQEIQIGGKGSWDDLSVDAAGRSLYVSHDSKVVVIDLDKSAVVG